MSDYIDDARNVLPNGLTLLQVNPDCAARLDPKARDHGWLYIKGADGQWVTHRKLSPHEIETAYDQSSDMKVLQGGKIMKTVSERLRRNANMCARVNAAVVLLCETALVGANEIERLEKQRDELLAALKDARELVDGWGAYASNYMQEKHDLAGDLAKLDAVIAKAEG